MIIVLATARLGEGAFEQGFAAMEAMIKASNAEPGCISYAYARDVLDPAVLHIVEKWDDDAALAAHFSMPHMAQFRQALARLDISIAEVRKFATDHGQPLG